MPNRVPWRPDYDMGHEALDAQHRNILAHCNALADCLDDESEEGDRKFRQTFDALMALAREHFVTEEALLAQSAYPELDDLSSEQEEYEYLAAEIVTTENFDKNELQTFLSLWWVGHIVGSGKKQRAFLGS